MKSCITCRVDQPTDNFYRWKGKNSEGHINTCKSCRTKMVYASKIKRLFGVDVTHKPTACQICGIETFTHVDHDHETGALRGYLCNDCNLLLGRAKDDVSILQKAIDYLTVGAISNR